MSARVQKESACVQNECASVQITWMCTCVQNVCAHVQRTSVDVNIELLYPHALSTHYTFTNWGQEIDLERLYISYPQKLTDNVKSAQTETPG